jgi:hypothetical protein
VPSLSSSSPPENGRIRSACLFSVFSAHWTEPCASTTPGSSASPFFGHR